MGPRPVGQSGNEICINSYGRADDASSPAVAWWWESSLQKRDKAAFVIVRPVGETYDQFVRVAVRSVATRRVNLVSDIHGLQWRRRREYLRSPSGVQTYLLASFSPCCKKRWSDERRWPGRTSDCQSTIAAEERQGKAPNSQEEAKEISREERTEIAVGRRRETGRGTKTDGIQPSTGPMFVAHLGVPTSPWTPKVGGGDYNFVLRVGQRLGRTHGS